MSLKLLKQSLEILDTPTNLENKKTPPTKTTKPQKSQTGRINRKEDHKRNKSFHSATNQKKTIQDIRKEILPDKEKANENMRRLLAMSQNTIKNEDANKIMKRIHKGQKMELEKLPKEQKSIFTEEDFAAFEREYFNS